MSLSTAAPTHPVAEKLRILRELMQAHDLDAYFVPSADEHLNEYLPQAKQRRAWISHFSGSMGDLLVGKERSWLFVDSRYYEQADREVDPACIQVSRLGQEGHISLTEQLQALAGHTGLRLGLDPFTVSVEHYRAWQRQLDPFGVELVSISVNLVDQARGQSQDPMPIWGDSALFTVPVDYTGASLAEKLTLVREKLQKTRATLLPITKLDQLAWLLNCRGQDIPYNPVFIGYGLVTPEQCMVFTPLHRIPAEVQAMLAPQVTLYPYEQYAATLLSWLETHPGTRIMLDPQHTTLGTFQLADPYPGTRWVEASHPIELLKARKNPTELKHMRQANLKASRAKTLTLKWIQDHMQLGVGLSEADVAAAIQRFYAQEDGFLGLSFNTISGSGANSSIVHYSTPDPQQRLQPGQWLLLDSGAQFWGGTTDDTRTVVIGDPTAEQISRYTQVLKAHINCAMQRFPKGTTGHQLDGITRAELWHSGLDYGHGTGHGVGAFLNVHEGPNGISKRANTALEPGMITSIEPGFYQAGWGGIRLENLYTVMKEPFVKRDLSERSDSDSVPPAPDPLWYRFDSLTYIPFERRLIDVEQLTPAQSQWLQHYNTQVMEKVGSTLDPDCRAWLSEQLFGDGKG